MRAAGFEAADLAVFPDPAFGHLRPRDLLSDLLGTTERVLQAAGEAGVAVAALNASVADDADGARAGQALCLLAHRVGAKVVTLRPGRGTPGEAALRLAPILTAADRSRVTLAAEVHVNSATARPGDALELLRLLPGLALTFDPSQVVMQGDDLVEW
ncbi:MAG: hypothetical protein AAB368_11435, partial [bacterium]